MPLRIERGYAARKTLFFVQESTSGATRVRFLSSGCNGKGTATGVWFRAGVKLRLLLDVVAAKYAGKSAAASQSPRSEDLFLDGFVFPASAFLACKFSQRRHGLIRFLAGCHRFVEGQECAFSRRGLRVCNGL